jgi:hypothetical protein
MLQSVRSNPATFLPAASPFIQFANVEVDGRTRHWSKHSTASDFRKDICWLFWRPPIGGSFAEAGCNVIVIVMAGLDPAIHALPLQKDQRYPGGERDDLKLFVFPERRFRLVGVLRGWPGQARP